MNIHRRVLVFNDAAGSGSPPEHIFDKFERVPVLETTEALSERTLDADTLVAVWGGDGTCRSVAGLLNGTNAALLPCPGGTHNHFARAAGIESVDDVEKAIHSESTELVDVGMFGNEVFLNNANVGWYVDLVERRQRFESRMPRKLAKGLALLVQLGRTRRFRVMIDGIEERVWMVWIGNGRFALAPTALTQRDDLGDGMLDLRILRAGSHLPKLRAFLVLLSGRAEESSGLDRRIVPAIDLTFKRPIVRVALDGELAVARSPVRVRCVTRSLSLRVPEERQHL